MEIHYQLVSQGQEEKGIDKMATVGVYRVRWWWIQLGTAGMKSLWRCLLSIGPSYWMIDTRCIIKIPVAYAPIMYCLLVLFGTMEIVGDIILYHQMADDQKGESRSLASSKRKHLNASCIPIPCVGIPETPAWAHWSWGRIVIQSPSIWVEFRFGRFVCGRRREPRWFQ